MRKLTVFLMLFAMVCSLSGSVNMAYASTTDNPAENICLEEYFLQREAEFETTMTGANTLSAVYPSNTNSRTQFIQEWVDGLNIIIKDSRIEYYTKEVLNDTENTLKLLVYEWVWIDYQCENTEEDGEEVIETMGFGTDHILTFSKNGDALELVTDSYQEITGYESGTAEDIAYLERHLFETGTGMENSTLVTSEVAAAGTVDASYSPSRAVSYSSTWCGNNVAGSSSKQNPNNYNPEYYYYSADCCNFVSQCLFEGGMTESGKWWVTKNTGDEPVEDSAYSNSGEAWRYVPTFVKHWKDLGHVETKITSADQAEPGNVIYYLKTDGYNTNHIMLIVGTNSNGQVLVNAHNRDAYRYPLTLSSKIYYTLEFTHCYNVASSNSIYHVLSCVLCGANLMEEHRFLITADGMRSCGVCGHE